MLVGAVATFVVAPSAAAGPALDVTFTVDDSGNEGDANNGDGICATAGGACTLRAAFDEASAGPATTIDIVVGTRTIDIAAGATQPLRITSADEKTVTVDGGGVANTIIDGGGEISLMAFDGQDVDVTITDMTLQNGLGDEGPAGIEVDNGASLTVQRLHLVDNEGGAIAAYPGDSSVRVEDSTFTGNSAGVGSAIYAEDEVVEIVNSTFVDNTGATVYAITSSEVSILHSTFARNSDENAGVALYSLNNSTITVENSVFEDSTDGEGAPIGNCVTFQGGTITSTGGNISDDDSCGFGETDDLEDTSTGTGPLQDNGGPTFTAAIDASSPAVDHVATCELDADQRGLPRPVDGDEDGTTGCDAGAFELQLEPEPTPTTEPTDTTAPADPGEDVDPTATAAPPAQPTTASPTFTG